ncbi:hypothetical protein BJX99DRAFT_264364 [Aspergillus californicus]
MFHITDQIHPDTPDQFEPQFTAQTLTQSLNIDIMHPIVTLPAEILEMVAKNLNVTDIGAFQLTCKYMGECAESYFYRFHLKTIRTSLSRSSLQSIEDLCKEPSRAEGVQTMVIRPLEGRNIGEGFKWSRCGEPDDRSLTQEGMISLRNILKALPNCRSFDMQFKRTITRHATHLGFAVDSYRDMPCNVIMMILLIMMEEKWELNHIVLDTTRRGITRIP